MTNITQDSTNGMTVNLVKTEEPYKGFFKMVKCTFSHEKYDGTMSGNLTREIFERGHAVGILPYDPVNDRVVLVEQFRPGAYAANMDPWVVEVPAGMIDNGETSEEAAHREIGEEAGCTVYDVKHIQRYLVSPGGTSETITLFCGMVDTTDGVDGICGLDSENEDIQVFTISAEEAKRRVMNGEITNSSTLISLMWFVMNHEKIKADYAK